MSFDLTLKAWTLEQRSKLMPLLLKLYTNLAVDYSLLRSEMPPKMRFKHVYILKTAVEMLHSPIPNNTS